MGCVSSAFLDDNDRLGRPALGHHIVSLTSTTYGLLTTLDHPPPHTPPPPPPQPPPPLPPSSSRLHLPDPEVINSWELMAGLDPTITPEPRISKHPPPTPTPESRISKQPPPIPKPLSFPGKENSDPNWKPNSLRTSKSQYSPEMFERRCPPGGEHAAVIYTTTLRGIRKTFEDCNAVRGAIEGLGVSIKERDVSMDMGFREELRELMKGTREGPTVPRVFVRGRYVGGAEEVLRIYEEGGLGRLLEGLPKARAGDTCDGCGGVRFLPCFQCNGSRKVVVVVVVEGEKGGGKRGGGTGKVVRCPECNENGLVLCPICC